MPKLTQLQQLFQKKLLGQSSNFTDFIAPSKQLTPTQRIDIYADTYATRLIDTLAISYPHLQKYMGEKKFHKLSQLYINIYQSNSYSIRYFGDQLSKLLKLESQFASNLLLSELSKFEWEINRAFDTINQPQITKQELAQVAPAKWSYLHFTINKAVSVFHCKYNIIKLWEALVTQQIKLPLAKVVQKNTLYIMTWRHDLHVKYKPLSRLEATVLKAAMKNKTFEELCAITHRFVTTEQVASTIGKIINSWLHQGIIVNIFTQNHYHE